MPVLRFKVDRLVNLTNLDIDEIRELLFRLKCETDIIEDELEVEINPDRPDMYLGEGIARAILGLRGKRPGWMIPGSINTRYVIENMHPSSRPYIAAAIVYNINVDEDFLHELIQFQEKLHDTIGRRRRKIAIGFHDLEKLPSSNLKYAEVPLTKTMVPLDHEKRMTIDKILKTTEQGQKYGLLSLNENVHPALLSGEEIIALPPVINSEITRVEPGTKNLFIDITGIDENTVLKALDVIVSTLTERPGAYIGKVKINNFKNIYTPILESKKLTLSVKYVNETLGTSLSTHRIKNALERMLHNVEDYETRLDVQVPPFRVDIINIIDLVEDVAIAIGYEELGYNKPITTDPGRLMDETTLSRILRDLAIGLGFTEVVQLTLTSPRLLDSTEYRNRVEIINPVQLEYSALRPSLIPSLLAVAQRNTHVSKPVKIFEIGNVILPGNPPTDESHIGFLIMDNEVGYEDMQAVIYSILRLLEIPFSVREYSHAIFIEGRTAELIDNRGRRIGVIGEISPEILERLGVSYPIVVAEMNLEVLATWKSRTMSQA